MKRFLFNLMVHIKMARKTLALSWQYRDWYGRQKHKNISKELDRYYRILLQNHKDRVQQKWLRRKVGR